jgi:hypothetical protein
MTNCAKEEAYNPALHRIGKKRRLPPGELPVKESDDKDKRNQ